MSTDLIPFETILSEIDGIERQMATPGYWRDETKQARYRELVTAKAQRQSATMAQGGGTALLPIMSTGDFAAEGGEDYGLYLDVMRRAGDVLFAMPEGEQQAFVASFEALPDSVTDVAVLELASRAPIVGLATEGAVKSFARTNEGAELVREWGEDAYRNVAVVRERFLRVLEHLDDADARRFTDWFDGLSGTAAKAVLRRLAA